MTDSLAPAIGLDWEHSAGVETLRRMASVDRYNRWIFRRLARYVGTRVLEVGCGIGNMTPFFLGAERMTCIDVLPESIAELRRQFASYPQVTALVADISHPLALQRIGRAQYDTVVCINVLEHVERDAEALRNMRDALVPGGRLLLFVPAGMYLYGHLDRALGHYRRYATEPLRDLLVSQGLRVVEAFHMNAAGIPGWFLSSRVLRRTAPPRGLLWLFNLLAPVFMWVEEVFQLPFGQSLVFVAERN